MQIANQLLTLNYKKNFNYIRIFTIQAENISKYAEIALMPNGLQKKVKFIKYYNLKILTLGWYDFKIKGIKEIDKKNLDGVIKTLVQWIDLSEEKVFNAFGKKYSELARGRMYGIEGHLTAKLFGDQIEVCKSMVKSCIEKKQGSQPLPGAKKWDKVLVFYDENQTPQSIALYDYSENRLPYLVTHSNNIKDPINKNQIRGTATKIMEYLIKISKSENRNLTLSTFQRTKRFYEKFGFVDDKSISYMHGIQAIPMIYKVAK